MQRREEAGGIETWRACPELIVYFWMASIMSSCEKMSEAVSSGFKAPGIDDLVFGRPNLSRERSEGIIL